MTTPTVHDPALVGVGLVSAFTLELFGLPIQPIIWGLIGGFLGLGWAKPAGRLVSAGVYLCASLVSALIGHALAGHYFDGAHAASNALAAFVALIFHPALSTIVTKLPAVADAFITAISSRGKP